MLHNEITNIIDRLDSHDDNGKVATTESQTEVDLSNTISGNTEDVTSMNDVVVLAADVNTYRQMIPYNTTDPERISQQESILELLINNEICNDETFKIFISEPDLHKERASQILDSLYCVSDNTVMENELSNAMTTDSATTVPTVIASNDFASNSHTDTDIPMSPTSQISNMASSLVLGEFTLRY